MMDEAGGRRSGGTRARVYLVALQTLIIGIMAAHLFAAPPLTRLHGILFAALGLLTLALLTISRRQLTATWFLALLVLGDTAVVLQPAQSASALQPWLLCEFVLLTVAVSYARSVSGIVLLSSVVAGSYGWMLYRLNLFGTDHAFLLPALLSMTMVFVSNTRMVQSEIERMTESGEQARSKTMLDVLTGLPNRAQFMERLARSIQCARINPDFQFAVLFIDLDGFKPINDRLGHKAGDAVLRETAKRLQACLRKGDTVGRYGGDEFTLLVNHVTGDADAIRVAERVLVKLKGPIDVGEPVKVGASIGIALSANLHERPEDLIRDADGAMYRAKAKGKNQYVFSDLSQDVPKEELKERLRRVVRTRW